jgi:cytochrome c5
VSQHDGTNFGNSISALIGVALLVALIYGVTAGRFANEPIPESPEQVAARLAPIGSVNTSPIPAAAPAPAAAAADADPGAATYNRVCQACHATGAAGAPLFGNKEAWAPRIAQGMDVLLHTAINGKGAMPPRGTCAQCSDDDLRAAIEYMVSKAQ